jgi:hypothetical protein
MVYIHSQRLAILFDKSYKGQAHRQLGVFFSFYFFDYPFLLPVILVFAISSSAVYHC